MQLPRPLLFLWIGLMLMFIAPVVATGQNLALNRPYVFSVAPNYPLSTGASDAQDLTDGQMGSGRFWTEQGAVGWQRITSPILITLDLGTVQAIGGVAVHAAAGSASVSWPHAITALVSDDGEVFRLAAELTTAGNELPSGYGEGIDHTFLATGLSVPGRYVRLVIVPSGSFTFIDEIEVHADTSPPITPPVVQLSEVTSPARLMKLGIQRRLLRDVAAVEAALDASNIVQPQRGAIETEIAQLVTAIHNFPTPTATPDEFRAVLPLNDLHRDIFAIHAQILRAEGYSGLTLWQTHRYAPLGPFDHPNTTSPQLRIEMMYGEHRAATFNITNASSQVQELDLTFQGLAGSPMPDEVEVFETQFTDTREGKVVSDALTPAQQMASAYRITIPAGMTRQIWLSFHASATTPEQSVGNVQLRGDGISEDVPLEWLVAPIELPPSGLAFQMWDYAANEAYAITAMNSDAVIANMRAYGVNTPWAQRATAPWPEASDFDAQGQLTGTLDFSSFDAFVSAWPDAARYTIFLNVSPGAPFGGSNPGTSLFDTKVGVWAQAWAAHMDSLGLSPGQVMLLLYDEPHNTAEWLVTLQWARAIKQATNAFTIFVDPVKPHPPAVQHSTEALQYCDIISPTRAQYEAAGTATQAYYQALATTQGKELWLYSCSGPTRHFSAAYFRLQPWRGFEIGATGSGFWGYADTGGTGNGWNPYTAVGRTSFTPVYLDTDSVTTSKHWEAAREGVQDYACLALLARYIAPEQVRDIAGDLLDQTASEFGLIQLYNDPEAVDVHEWTDQARLDVLDVLANIVTVSCENGVDSYLGTDDNVLYAEAGTNNYGDYATLRTGYENRPGVSIGDRRAILRFDVSSLAGTYQAINRARLVLTQRELSYYQYEDDFTLTLHQITEANAGWVEGAERGVASEGTSAWEFKAWATSPGSRIPWAGSAGLSSAGTDYVSEALATATYTTGDPGDDEDADGTHYVFELPPSLVEQWITGTNAGLLLLSDDGVATFWSSDLTYADPAAHRPRLIIEYTPTAP